MSATLLRFRQRAAGFGDPFDEYMTSIGWNQGSGGSTGGGTLSSGITLEQLAALLRQQQSGGQAPPGNNPPPGWTAEQWAAYQRSRGGGDNSGVGIQFVKDGIMLWDGTTIKWTSMALLGLALVLLQSKGLQRREK
jgi:hypothetical protein